MIIEIKQISYDKIQLIKQENIFADKQKDYHIAEHHNKINYLMKKLFF